LQEGGKKKVATPGAETDEAQEPAKGQPCINHFEKRCDVGKEESWREWQETEKELGQGGRAR